MSEEAIPVRRSVPSKTIKRGLAWVLALGSGVLGLCTGYAIGERQTRIACLAKLDASCPKLPIARPQAARGKGSDLHFYEDLAPERSGAPTPVVRSTDLRARDSNRVAQTESPRAAGSATQTADPKNVASGRASRSKTGQDAKSSSLSRSKSMLREHDASKAVSSSSKTDARGPQSLQFGSFPTRAEAEVLAERLRAHDLSARVVTEAGPNQSNWYKVRVGHFSSTDVASQAKARLGAGGATAVLVKDTDGPH